MSDLILGAAFDSSSIYSDKHRFNNIELTKHDKLLEGDYKLFRNEGFTFFRESAWLERTFSRKGVNWNWLDRLAKISNGEIQLGISHYDWIESTVDFWRFIADLAERYKGVFHSYIPYVESGVYCHMLCEYLYPRFYNWGDAWRQVSMIQNNIASLLKNADNTCKIALSEPFNSFMDWDEQALPFRTVDNLDIVGINILHHDDKVPVHVNIEEAAKRFPNKEIFIAETTNVWHQNWKAWDWLEYVSAEVLIAQAKGINITKVMWCPSIQMYAHDTQELIGGYLYDINRKKNGN